MRFKGKLEGHSVHVQLGGAEDGLEVRRWAMKSREQAQKARGYEGSEQLFCELGDLEMWVGQSGWAVGNE